MLLDDVLQHMQNNSIGTRGTDLFGGNLPDIAPGGGRTHAAAVKGYGGTSGVGNDATFDTIGATYDQPRVQIMVRDTDEGTAYAFAEQIYRLFVRAVNITITGSAPFGSVTTAYLGLVPVNPPAWAGLDANNKPIYSINLAAHRKV